MRRTLLAPSIALAAGLILASAPRAGAQVTLSIGSPYPAAYAAAPVVGYGYPAPYPGPATAYYSSGYSGVVAPAPYVATTTRVYAAAPAYGLTTFAAPAPAYAYPAYGVYRIRRPGPFRRAFSW